MICSLLCPCKSNELKFLVCVLHKILMWMISLLLLLYLFTLCVCVCVCASVYTCRDIKKTLLLIYFFKTSRLDYSKKNFSFIYFCLTLLATCSYIISYAFLNCWIVCVKEALCPLMKDSEFQTCIHSYMLFYLRIGIPRTIKHIKQKCFPPLRQKYDLARVVYMPVSREPFPGESDTQQSQISLLQQ